MTREAAGTIMLKPRYATARGGRYDVQVSIPIEIRCYDRLGKVLGG